MTRWRIKAVGLAVLGGLAYLLNGNQDLEVWAALFWISAIGNFVLFMVLYDQRERTRKPN